MAGRHALLDAERTATASAAHSWVLSNISTPTYRCSSERPIGGTLGPKKMFGLRADGSPDGEWWTCFDQSGVLSAIRDVPRRRNSQTCVIYSFGVGSDWSFDEAMGTGDAFNLNRRGAVPGLGCDVFAFDQTSTVATRACPRILATHLRLTRRSNQRTSQRFARVGSACACV
jgi:hypothetical protein